jgi:hypothetical protein
VTCFRLEWKCVEIRRNKQILTVQLEKASISTTFDGINLSALVELNYLEGKRRWNVRLMITPSKILENHLNHIDLNMLKRKSHYSSTEKQNYC